MNTKDPLISYLLDIVSDPAGQGLILAGGFGIRLKQEILKLSGVRTLIEEIPDARATLDLDFFARIELWTQKERAKAVSALLASLGYTVNVYNWQFAMQSPFPLRTSVKVDLLARSPTQNEPVKVKHGQVGKDMKTGIAGFETPEAFAVEEALLALEVSGISENGRNVTASVYVPHPYSWINMKIKAAYDWLQRQRDDLEAKPNSEKHAFDVYILTAMLIEEELDQASLLAEKYAQHSVATEIRAYAVELFGTPNSPGFREASRQAGHDLDHSTFWEGLCNSIGTRA